MKITKRSVSFLYITALVLQTILVVNTKFNRYVFCCNIQNQIASEKETNFELKCELKQDLHFQHMEKSSFNSARSRAYV